MSNERSPITGNAPLSQPKLWFDRALLPSGWARGVRLRLQNGCIAAIEVGVPAESNDERHLVAVPGMPNVHSHAFQRGIAGLTARRGASHDSFWSWREVMYKFVQGIEPEDLQAITAQAYVEMLESGFTRVGEFHYLHHDARGVRYMNLAENCERIIEAAAETGIGLTLLPVLYAHSDFGAAPPRAAQARFVCAQEEFAALLDFARKHAAPLLEDVIVGAAAHSLRAVTEVQLAAVDELARESPLHIHIAEQAAEVRACLAWSGLRPIEWLMQHAPVDGRWCLVHATHVTESELQCVVRSQAVVGLCPITEADLGDGLFPAREYLFAGGRFGVGSDSNVLIDPSHELRLLEYGQRLQHQARNVLARSQAKSTARSLFDEALAGGTRAVGVARGGFEVGASADIVTLNVHHPALLACSDDQLLDGWIFAARSTAVDCVWRRGRRVVQSGRHVAQQPIAERYERALRRLLL